MIVMALIAGTHKRIIDRNNRTVCRGSNATILKRGLVRSGKIEGHGDCFKKIQSP